MVALVSIGYLVILIVFHFAKGDTMAERGEIRYVKWGGAIATLSSFPVIVFAYTCHQNVRLQLDRRLQKLTDLDVLNFK